MKRKVCVSLPGRKAADTGIIPKRMWTAFRKLRSYERLELSLIHISCHTGNKSCFFHEIAKTEYKNTNPLKVFENVYKVIADRKAHPKEGSYTNYLFDKGIDKILKKVGEEATELVIAAKNPDPEEIKYEMSDLLYHAMVLMVERGVTWEDITAELANR